MHFARTHFSRDLFTARAVGAASPRTVASRVPEYLKFQRLSVTHARVPQGPLTQTHASHSPFTLTASAVLDRLPRLPLACLSRAGAAAECFLFNQDMPLRGPTVSLREGLVGAARKESMLGAFRLVKCSEVVMPWTPGTTQRYPWISRKMYFDHKNARQGVGRASSSSTSSSSPHTAGYAAHTQRYPWISKDVL